MAELNHQIIELLWILEVQPVVGLKAHLQARCRRAPATSKHALNHSTGTHCFTLRDLLSYILHAGWVETTAMHPHKIETGYLYLRKKRPPVQLCVVCHKPAQGFRVSSERLSLQGCGNLRPEGAGQAGAHVACRHGQAFLHSKLGTG